jgi:hypothetical protein
MAVTINASTTTGLVQSADTSGIIQLQSNGTTAVTIDTSQRVAFVAGTDALPAITTTGDTNTGMFFPAADTVAASTGGTERMRITSAGNVLIGCTAVPSASVEGKRIKAGSGETTSSSGSSTSAYSHWTFINGNGDVGNIQTNGSATAYNTSSDYRLKENIAPMTGALATVTQLKPVTYDWKAGGSSQGFIAHELQAVVPDCVTGEKDGEQMQGVDTSFLVATLTAAIQELNAKVEAQAVRIAELEGAK